MAITRSASRNMAGSMTWPFNTGVFVPLLFAAAITARACVTASGEGVKMLLIAASCSACKAALPVGPLVSRLRPKQASTLLLDTSVGFTPMNSPSQGQAELRALAEVGEE